MASVLNNFFDQLKSAWEPLTPPDDGSLRLYQAIDTLENEVGLGQHRQFYFEHFEDGLPNQTSGNIYLYDQPVYVFWDRRHRAYELFVRSVNDECQLLSSGFWNGYFPGGGVSSAQLIRVTNDTPKANRRTPLRAGGVPREQTATKCFLFRVRADET